MLVTIYFPIFATFFPKAQTGKKLCMFKKIDEKDLLWDVNGSCR